MGASAETPSIRTHETQEVVRYKGLQRLHKASAQKDFSRFAHMRRLFRYCSKMDFQEHAKHTETI